jgi:hypothetical protein
MHCNHEPISFLPVHIWKFISLNKHIVTIILTEFDAFKRVENDWGHLTAGGDILAIWTIAGLLSGSGVRRALFASIILAISSFAFLIRFNLRCSSFDSKLSDGW